MHKLEQVYYSINNGPWVQFDTKTYTYPYPPQMAINTQYTDYAQLDVKKLPPGGYKIKVYATSSDAPDAAAEIDPKSVGGTGKVFIKLEASPFDYSPQNQKDSIITQFFKQMAQNPWGILQHSVI